VYIGFFVMAAVGLALALRHKGHRGGVFFGIGFLLFSFLGTAMGFYFRYHYFVLLLPALALAVGLAVALMESSLPASAKMVPLVVVAGIVAGEVYMQAGPFFHYTQGQYVGVTYGGNPFAETVPVARYIRENSRPDATVAVVGSEPEIYFYSARHSATGYIYVYPLMETQPYALAMQHEMIGEIEAHKPEFLVLVMNKFSWCAVAESDYTIINWSRRYAEQFYDAVRIIGRGPDGKMVWGAGDEVNRLRGQIQQHIIVFKRKPDGG